MKQFIYDVIKKASGNLLTIGIDDKKLFGAIKNNANINVYTIDKIDQTSIFRRNKRKSSTGKDVNLKKLHKYFNKKSIDIIICNIEEIKDFIKYFVRDSIYLNCDKLYIYGNNDIVDIQFLIKKYKRYKVSIEKKIDGNDYLLIIDNTKSKNKRIMDKIYFIKDTLINLADFISNILVS